MRLRWRSVGQGWKVHTRPTGDVGNPPPVSGPAEAFALNPSTSPPTGLRTVTSRRRFLGSLVSASADLPTMPALTNDALAHVVRTVGAVAGRPPAAIAEDEEDRKSVV